MVVTKFFNDQGGLKKIAAELETAKSKMPPNVRGAHDYCSRHRSEILMSALCACFYCRENFAPDEILDWVDNQQTALCPKCGIDAVIGFPLTKEFLDEMHEYWF